MSLVISGMIIKTIHELLVGGFKPSEKYESQWEELSHIVWTIKHVPYHQPAT